MNRIKILNKTGTNSLHENKNKLLGFFLCRDQIIKKAELDRLIEKATLTSKPLSELLYAHCQADKHPFILSVLSDIYALPSISLSQYPATVDSNSILPLSAAGQYKTVIFKTDQQTVSVAMINPEQKDIITFVQRTTKRKALPYLATPTDIEDYLKKMKSSFPVKTSPPQMPVAKPKGSVVVAAPKETVENNTIRKIKSQVESVLIRNNQPLQYTESVDFNAIQLINEVIEKGISCEASDIHIQPTQTELLVRYRVDGLLKTMGRLPKKVSAELLASIKIMANLKIDEHRLPQDGRLSFYSHTVEVSIRVSILPTLNGSKVVLRLLGSKPHKIALGQLGLNRNDLSVLEQQIKKPHGMVLVTGPTGSGKTTTLYSFVNVLNQEQTNICTVEDPIEYGIEGISQTQINPAVDLNFANSLRALLRQDPDVLMVGEIRDHETAVVAVNAAMTGHLVLTTLHANSAFLAAQRLIDMGIPAYLLSSVVNAVIGQRLVRTICQHCKTVFPTATVGFQNYPDTEYLLESFKKFRARGLLTNPVDSFDQLMVAYGKGCQHCNFTGYKGRTGIYEIASIDDELKRIIIKGGNPAEMRATVLAKGGLTMQDDGLLKVMNGETTLSEVSRVTTQ